MSEEKKKIDNRRTIDPAALAVIDRNSENGQHETAYDRYVKMQPQCNFGRTGVCCRICLQGPCRITKKSSKGVCGAHGYTIVARNLIRSISGGTGAHSDHSRHMLYALMEVLDGKAPDYGVEDPTKLRRVASRLGIEIEGKDDHQLLEAVLQQAISDYTKITPEPCKWLETTVVPERMEKFNACNIQPRSIHTTIAETMGQTHMGVDADPVNLIFQGLKTSLCDYICMHIGTDLSDILFGTPKPVYTEANFGVMDPEMVNIAVHGHNPLLSEMIVRQAREMKAEAEAAGAKGVKCMGVCCTGNEVLMRQGVPVLTNFLSQELPIMTGSLDAMVVDVQCIMPGVKAASECYHTRIVTTMSHSKIPGSYHVDFSEEHAVEKAREVINLAIEAFKERSGKGVDIPDIKHKVTAGFSMEAMEEILGAINPDEPIKVVTDAIDSGQLRGVVLFAGCNNLRVPHDASGSYIMKEMAKNNVLIVATGCAAGTAAKLGLLNADAVEEYAGEGLKSFIHMLNDANKDKLKEKLPLIFHMGSCVDNSRAYDFTTALARQWKVDVPKVPFVASAPEAMSEKAVSIGSWCVTLGVPTHVGVVPEVTGSALVDGIALQIAEDVYGGYFIWEEDPEKAAEKILAALDERSWKLKIHQQTAEKYETELSKGW
ncbi:MAG: anaerobic carbon-monoxide dehydrogenase catalytic subunit [Firmicutes bacterium]|nr:anaerobic carbon-monoxide dehydrogenase catalytic subunit [Bacillota bacterium]